MKKQFFFSMLAAAAMMASCSSDKIVENSANNEYGLIEGQPAFINVGIAMPGSAQTRANDDFDDGADAEYEVKSGKLVLFKGDDEATAELFAAYDIPTTAWNKETSTNQITTTSANYVQEIESPNLTGAQKLFAYVILNNSGNDTGISYASSQTFATFSTTVLKAIGIANEAAGQGALGTNGFVMTSTPIADVRGGDNDPNTAKITALTPIDPSAVYDNRPAAEAASASVACIYVERAAVKVQVDWSATINDPAGGTAKVQFEGWTLGNVNNGGASGSGYYNTRQVETAWNSLFNAQNTVASTKYRFICGSPLFASAHKMGYRTYFGKDVNYNADATNLVGAQVAATAHSLGKNAITYTYENTFDEDHQIYHNTTYVSIKTTLNDGHDFYNIEGQHNTALDETSLKNHLAVNIDNEKSSEIAAFKSLLEAAVSTDLANTSGKLQTAGVASGATITFKLKHNIALGSRASDGRVPYTDNLSVYDIQIDGVAALPAEEAAFLAITYSGSTIGDYLNNHELNDYVPYTANTVHNYKNGVTYYTVRIAHFGDNETPWSAPAAAYNLYDQIYPSTGTSAHVSPETPVNYGAGRAAAWLGRWGIVRNNWYLLSVSDIQGIGDAEPLDYSGTATGTPGGTPDDNPKPKYYIKAHIHILPWVKRLQNVIL